MSKFKTNLPRIDAYYEIENRTDEVPWIRPTDLKQLELPRPIVLVNGAFDILHSGHMKVIFRAWKEAKGGTVLLALDSDAKVARKGSGRPIQTFIERATALNYMPVSVIVEITSEEDMLKVIRAAEPDVRIQGWDYHDKDSRYPWVPKIYVRGIGMRTSKIIERCKSVE